MEKKEPQEVLNKLNDKISSREKLFFGISLILFITVNTNYFWRVWLDSFFMFFIEIIVFLGLLIFALIQLVKIVGESYKNKIRIILTFGLSLILTSSYFYPTGLINFSKYEAEDIIVARRIGTPTHCQTILQFKSNNRFFERYYCFGFEEYRGNYMIENDTIRFTYDKTLSTRERTTIGIIELNDKNDENKLIGVIYFKPKPNEARLLPFSIQHYEIHKDK